MSTNRLYEAVIAEARRVGEHVGRFTEQLLAGPSPWSKLRQAQKLLRLANKYGGARVDVACRRAFYFELFDVGPSASRPRSAQTRRRSRRCP